MTINNLHFRKAQPSDLPFLLSLRRATMEIHLIASGIYLDEAAHRQRVQYHFEGARIVLLAKQAIGLLKVVRHVDKLEILQFQIDPRQQGKGIGRKVIELLLDEAAKEALPVRLSVLKTNPAKRLYERLGFIVVEEDENSFLMLKT